MRYVERVASQFRTKAGLEDPVVEDAVQDPVVEEEPAPKKRRRRTKKKDDDELGFGVNVGTADED